MNNQPMSYIDVKGKNTLTLQNKYKRSELKLNA
jgi:hypothetical protein